MTDSEMLGTVIGVSLFIVLVLIWWTVVGPPYWLSEDS